MVHCSWYHYLGKALLCWSVLILGTIILSFAISMVLQWQRNIRVNRALPLKVVIDNVERGGHAPGDIVLRAVTDDAVIDKVYRVSFYVDSQNLLDDTKIGEDATVPFTAIYKNAPGGDHIVYAISFDKNGLCNGRSERVLISIK